MLGPGETDVQSRGLAAPSGHLQQREMRGSRPANDLDGAIRRAVGDEQHLKAIRRVSKRGGVDDLALDARLFVVNGDDHRDRGQRRGPVALDAPAHEGPKDHQNQWIPEVRVHDAGHRQPERDLDDYHRPTSRARNIGVVFVTLC